MIKLLIKILQRLTAVTIVRFLIAIKKNFLKILIHPFFINIIVYRISSILICSIEDLALYQNALTMGEDYMIAPWMILENGILQERHPEASFSSRQALLDQIGDKLESED